MYKCRYENEGRTTNCFPVDEDDTMWIEKGKTVKELMELAKIKWPDVEFEDINIDVVHHHQYSIYYDSYDSTDYVDYLVLSVEL